MSHGNVGRELCNLPGSPSTSRVLFHTRVSWTYSGTQPLCGLGSSAAFWPPGLPSPIPAVDSRLLRPGLLALCSATWNTAGHRTGHASLLSWDHRAMGSPVERGQRWWELGGISQALELPHLVILQTQPLPQSNPQTHPQKREAFELLFLYLICFWI